MLLIVMFQDIVMFGKLKGSQNKDYGRKGKMSKALQFFQLKPGKTPKKGSPSEGYRPSLNY